jgi:hypothetical protein
MELPGVRESDRKIAKCLFENAHQLPHDVDIFNTKPKVGEWFWFDAALSGNDVEPVVFKLLSYTDNKWTKEHDGNHYTLTNVYELTENGEEITTHQVGKDKAKNYIIARGNKISKDIIDQLVM